MAEIVPIISATLRVNDGRTREFWYHDHGIVRNMVTDVIEGKSYPYFKGEWVKPFEPKVIVDVGANIGAFSVYMGLSCPDAVIHAFEPSSRAVQLLHKNVQGLNVTIYNCGLDDSNRKETLYHNAVGYMADSINPCNYNGITGEEQIDLRDFAGAMQMLAIDEIDILKIDAEGCEVPILESMLGADISPKWLYLEFHCEEDRRSIDELLGQTHKWYWGRIEFNCHRGEMLWIRNDMIEPIVDRLQITPRRKVCV